MSNPLDGKVALITGAGRGIGAATAKTLAAAGATIIVTDIDGQSAETICEEIKSSAGQARAYTHDISDDVSWQQVLQAVDDEFGKLNVLVNNAGIVIVKPIEETTSSELEHITRINIFGTYFGIQKSLPLLKTAADIDNNNSSIVNFSSAMGIKGYPFGATYSMSKGAIRLLTKSAALEFAQLGYPVRVNSIHPGLVETPMVAHEAKLMASYGAFGENTPEKVIEALKAYNPLGRFADAVEIAKAVLFLASDDSSFMNGSELVVDGGETA